MFASRALLGTHRPVTALIVSRLLHAAAPPPRAAWEDPTGQQLCDPKTSVARGGTCPGTALRFSLAPGATVQIVSTVLTSISTGAAPGETMALAVEANAKSDSEATVAQAAAFWRTFWARSSITLPPKWAHVERFWYASQYLLAMSSRRGRVAPAIWGNWITSDAGLWGGG